jgi:hypothetical protein
MPTEAYAQSYLIFRSKGYNWYKIEDCSKTFLNWFYEKTLMLDHQTAVKTCSLNFPINSLTPPAFKR